MLSVKTARLIFCLAAMLFVAKPFIGFGLPRHIKSPVKTNIVVKIFSKRKIEDGRKAMNTIQRILSSPADVLVPCIALLLCILFPPAFLNTNESDNQLLGRLQLKLQPQALTVANSQFRI